MGAVPAAPWSEISFEYFLIVKYYICHRCDFQEM